MENLSEDLELSKQNILGWINDAIQCTSLEKMANYIEDIKGSIADLKCKIEEANKKEEKRQEYLKELDKLYLDVVNLKF